MKQYSLLLAVFLSVIGMQAQDARSFSLNLYGGYNFSDKLDYDNYSATIEDGFQYGAGFEYFFSTNNSVEVKYLRTDVKIPVYGPLGTQLNSSDDKGAFNFILADFTHYFDTGTNLLPYLGAGAGVGIVETPQSGSGTYFAWDIKGGVKIKTASIVSVNINAYLQSMSAAVGDSYYWTYYYGPVAVQDYVSTFQFGLGAVLSFNFKK
ncbi:outer membrane beta-barrel protein [Flavobacterium defluvii]|uniref:Outer membrane protein beta-barrel domain-containing protein n=1 Tax=Flavobacterium defluvii TaxID=370979 RepID=A0A1M5IDJ2_9FLAO|nr:outer membrane beta-barrel protein [Flavobacterium defluvii]SHG26414.1 Outer membrane protein beta-barrel domain-containing protein [Flavobacterium defluvii]